MKVLFLVLVYVFNFNLFEFSAAILEKGLLYIACSKETLYHFPIYVYTLVANSLDDYELQNAPLPPPPSVSISICCHVVPLI